jgi:hypothetical protein
MRAAREIPVRRLARISLALSAVVLGGCSAATPVLVEPRAPGVGDLRVQAGGAAIVPVAGDSGAIAAAANPGNGSDAAAKHEAGVVQATLLHPGVAPVVRAQVGVTPEIEVSLRFGGRDLGLGGRWIFLDSRSEQGGATTLSIGFEGRALLRGQPNGTTTADALAADQHGYGATVPFVLAWQSDAGLVSAYAAALVGGDVVDVDYRRVFGAATVGLGVGFRRVRAIVELGLERDWLHGELTTPVDLRVWSLAPAFALSVRL